MSLEQLLEKMDKLSGRFDNLQKDVEDLKSDKRSRSRSPRGRRTESADNWADRTEPPRDTQSPFPYGLSQEAEEEGDSESMEVSEPTHHLLTLACTKSMSNDQRRETRKRYKLPRVPATKTPRLDSFMKAEVPQNAKSLDGELARIQTLVMDAAAPLTTLIEEKIQEGETEGNTPEAEQILSDAMAASLALIGNAHSHISQLRREKVITSLNKSLLPLIKDDVDFATAVPFLFGTDFAKRSKDFTDQMKALRAATQKPTTSNYKRPLFRRGPFSGRGRAPRWRGGASLPRNSREQQNNQRQ